MGKEAPQSLARVVEAFTGEEWQHCGYSKREERIMEVVATREKRKQRGEEEE